MKKLFGMLATALAIVACNKINEIDVLPIAPDVPSEINEGITITARLEPKNPVTRALAEGVDEITVTWALDEDIAILYEVSSVKKMAQATVTAVDGETGAATITFIVDGGTGDDTPCTLVYPASAAKADHSGVNSYANLLASQDGTLNANLDVRVGEGTIQVTTPDLTVTTKLTAQYSIFKFSLTTDGSTPINAKGFVIRDDGDNLITSVSPEAPASSLFVAIPAKAAGAGFRFVASDGTKKYTKSISLVRATESGVYYQTPLNMGDGVALPETDLSGITVDYTATDFETLTGTLTSKVKISVAAGATVTLNNATIDGISINNDNSNSYKWAGITCNGDATIILNGNNSVAAFYGSSGIYIPSGSTLTIQGPGSLTANGRGTGGAGIGACSSTSLSCGNIRIEGGAITAIGGTSAAGIGGGAFENCGDITITGGTITASGGAQGCGIGSGANNHSCGDITISGGTITATGGDNASGIGSSANGACGNILINGGTVTATAAGYYGPGIGCGPHYSSCSSITITSDVTRVTATKASGTPNSIGSGYNSTGCGPVTIGGLVLWDGSAYQNGGGDYLPASPLVYIPSAPSAFSVSSTQKVYFSPGNLQCIPNTRAWRFAENQWGYIGVGGPSEPGNAHRMWEGDSYTDWYDIFGWGTWTGSSPNPAKADQYNTSYAWGDGDFTEESLLANAPLPGKNWRTLSQTEWAYLFNTRETTSGVRYAKATVNSVEGVILLPDDWSTSYHSLASTNTAEAAYTANEISAAAWMIDFEAHGAIFLPVATIHYYGSGPELFHTGNYWSSTPYSETIAYCVNFSSSTLSASYTHDRSTAISVRLVYND